MVRARSVASVSPTDGTWPGVNAAIHVARLHSPSMDASNWEVRVGFKAARSAPWAIFLPLAAAAVLGSRAPRFFMDRVTERLPACDRAIVRKPAIRAMLASDVTEAFRQGPEAFLHDLRLEARPWEIPFEQVSCPIALWHGSRDTIVPPHATEVMASLLPHASVRIFPDAGHFFVFDVWHEVLDWLVRR